MKQHNQGFLDLVNDARKNIREINISEYQELASSGQPFTLIDTREDNEWQAGHAAGAIHLSRGIIERDIEAKIPDRSTRLVLYCGGGYRSALAAESLQKMGYTDVISLNGGWSAWKQAGLPTE